MGEGVGCHLQTPQQQPWAHSTHCVAVMRTRYPYPTCARVFPWVHCTTHTHVLHRTNWSSFQAFKYVLICICTLTLTHTGRQKSHLHGHVYHGWDDNGDNNTRYAHLAPPHMYSHTLRVTRTPSITTTYSIELDTSAPMFMPSIGRRRRLA